MADNNTGIIIACSVGAAVGIGVALYIKRDAIARKLDEAKVARAYFKPMTDEQSVEARKVMVEDTKMLLEKLKAEAAIKEAEALAAQKMAEKAIEKKAEQILAQKEAEAKKAADKAKMEKVRQAKEEKAKNEKNGGDTKKA